MTRERALRWLRWIAALALLGLVLSQLEFAILADAVRRVSIPVLFALVGLMLLQQAILTARFRIAVRAWSEAVGSGERPLTFRALFGDQLVSNAYNVILPSAIGGDVYRVVAAREFARDGGAGALGIVMTDRLLGLGVLALVPAIYVAFGMGIGWLLGVLLLAIAAVVWTDRLATFGIRLVPKRLGRVHEFLDVVARGIESVGISDRWKMCGWALVHQVAVGVFFELTALGWDVGSGLHEAIWVGIPLASILTIIPISIGGMGIRESLFVVVARRAGLPPELGLALALFWAGATLVAALGGLAVHLARATRD